MPGLQTLNVKHYMIAHLLAQGKSKAVICRRLNVSYPSIERCLETPEFNAILDNLENEYSQKIADQVILPFAEMQNRINEEALGALSRVVDISQSERANSTVLNANLALLDRASNTPKASKGDAGEAPRDLFNVSVVQLVLETALQVGDKTILGAAQRALSAIPTLGGMDDTGIVDLEPGRPLFDALEPLSTPPTITKSSFERVEGSVPPPVGMKSLDDVLDEVWDEGDEE